MMGQEIGQKINVTNIDALYNINVDNTNTEDIKDKNP
jgi:uncharacterized protein YfkK (UPF0435 family)